MCVLLVNHYMLAEGKVRQEELLEKSIELCLRIKRENDDMSMATQANQLHGICLLMLNRPCLLYTSIDKRKEKGITQEDLAEYIGVSKASVSKWETGVSQTKRY